MNNDTSYEARPEVQASHILKLFPLILGYLFLHSTRRKKYAPTNFDCLI